MLKSIVGLPAIIACAWDAILVINCVSMSTAFFLIKFFRFNDLQTLMRVWHRAKIGCEAERKIVVELINYPTRECLFKHWRTQYLTSTKTQILQLYGANREHQRPQHQRPVRRLPQRDTEHPHLAREIRIPRPCKEQRHVLHVRIPTQRLGLKRQLLLHIDLALRPLVLLEALRRQGIQHIRLPDVGNTAGRYWVRVHVRPGTATI